MGFEDPNKLKTTKQILSDFDAWKESTTKKLKFLLVKDCGLDSGVEVTFDAAPGKRINYVTFRHMGLVVKFLIRNKSIELAELISYNDDNVNVIEEEMISKYTQILIDYFEEHQDDRPE